MKFRQPGQLLKIFGIFRKCSQIFIKLKKSRYYILHIQQYNSNKTMYMTNLIFHVLTAFTHEISSKIFKKKFHIATHPYNIIKKLDENPARCTWYLWWNYAAFWLSYLLRSKDYWRLLNNIQVKWRLHSYILWLSLVNFSAFHIWSFFLMIPSTSPDTRPGQPHHLQQSQESGTQVETPLYSILLLVGVYSLLTLQEEAFLTF